MDATRINPADVSERCKRCARYNPDVATATGPEWYSDTAPCRGMNTGFTGCICFQPRPGRDPGRTEGKEGVSS